MENFPIELRTLGTLQLRDARGRDLCGKLQPKRLALLIYLAHAPRRFHRRDSLLALFWPDLDSRGARNSLRQSLYSLRRTLGEGVLTGRGYEQIAVGDLLWSDVVALDSALEGDQAKAALDLYRGDLLEGFHVQSVAPEFEYWLESERFRLRDKLVRAALALVDREEARGDLSAAVEDARIAARIDSDNESVLRKMIGLLDRTGDRAGAIKAYEAFARRAREEYELAPTEETRSLIEVVRAREEVRDSPIEPEPEVLEPPTTFIGRRQELAALERFLKAPAPRLLTLTGLGGCGKTRLALECAARMKDHFEQGVAIVGIGEVREADGIFSAIAHGLGLPGDGPQGPREALREYLDRRELLLVLDGFVPARAAGAEVVRLLRSALRLKVLITSRAPLNVSGEQVFPVPSLSLPQPGPAPIVDFPLNSEAVALFVDRARAVRPDFRLRATNVDAVAEICRRLDGLPLAIELAAARVRALTPQAIAKRLEDRFALLTGGPSDLPARHQTLEAAIGWSCELLDESEHTLFRRLSVFAAGFGLELVEPLFEAHGVSTIDLIDDLATLVDHSLVRQLETSGEPRFEMLDTVRAYAQKLLTESSEEDAWRRQHAMHLLGWIEDGEQYYCTPGQDDWFSRLEGEHDNIRAVLRWTLHREEAVTSVRLAAALWPFWWSRGYLAEGGTWLGQVLALEDEDETARPARAKALLGACSIALAGAKHEHAARLAEESATLYQVLGDEPGFTRALETLGFVHLEAGDVEPAEAAFRECLERSRKNRDDRRAAIALDSLGEVALARGEDRVAEPLFRESVSLARRIGHLSSVGQGVLRLGDLALRAGAPDRAASLYEEALATYRQLGQKMNVAWILSSLGGVRMERGQVPAAREMYAEALSLFRELGYVRGTARTLAGFAAISLAQGDRERAVRLLGGIEILLERADDHLPTDDATTLASLQDTAREQLGKPDFSALRAEGRALDEEALVELAAEAEVALERRALG